jgi:hypothetical protein
MTLMALVTIVGLAACDSSDSSPDSSAPDSAPDVTALSDGLADSSPGTPDTGAGDTPGCGPDVSAQDCQRCGPPSADCQVGSPQPVIACSPPANDLEHCCFVGAGRYCSCDGQRWHVTICDPSAPDAGGGH